MLTSGSGWRTRNISCNHGNTDSPGILVGFEREAEGYYLFVLFSRLSPFPSPEAMATEPTIFHRLLHQPPDILSSGWTCLASCRLQLTHLPHKDSPVPGTFFQSLLDGPFVPQIHPMSKVYIMFFDTYNDSLSISKQ